MRASTSRLRATAFTCGGATLLLAATCAAAEPDPPFLPGVPADAARRTAFAVGEAGRLVAVDLAAGRVRWSAEAGLHPVGVAAEGLLAWKAGAAPNELSLFWLEEASGRTRPAAGPLALPAWVSVEPAAGTTFETALRPHREGLLFTWSARRGYAGGARPTHDEELQARQEASGAFRLTPGRGPVAVAVDPEGGRGAESHPYFDGHRWRNDPLEVGSTQVTFALERREGGAETLSATVRQAGSTRTRQIFTGRDLFLQVAADGRHLFVREALPADAGAASEWQVFRLEGLAAVGRIPWAAGTAALALSGEVVYALVDDPAGGKAAGRLTRRLEAWSLPRRARLWSLPVQGRPRLERPRTGRS